MRTDEDGEFWNYIIDAVVGGLVGGIVAGVTSYIQTGTVDWGSVLINTAVGAVSGVIAASGLGMLAQAGLTAVTSSAGNFAEQCYTNGIENVNYTDVALTGLIGGATSLLGSGAGKLVGKKLDTASASLIRKGRDKLLTGMIRGSAGQSHSALIRQGTKYIMQGTKILNTFRGLSSVVGSVIGGGITGGYNATKNHVFGW